MLPAGCTSIAGEGTPRRNTGWDVTALGGVLSPDSNVRPGLSPESPWAQGMCLGDTEQPERGREGVLGPTGPSQADGTWSRSDGSLCPSPSGNNGPRFPSTDHTPGALCRARGEHGTSCDSHTSPAGEGQRAEGQAVTGSNARPSPDGLRVLEQVAHLWFLRLRCLVFHRDEMSPCLLDLQKT